MTYLQARDQIMEEGSRWREGHYVNGLITKIILGPTPTNTTQTEHVKACRAALMGEWHGIEYCAQLIAEKPGPGG